MPTDLERIAAARRAYTDLAPRVRAGEPWPLATTFGTEPEAEWGPREVLAHVEEMLPFWLGELERVVDPATAPGPVAFGRTAEDMARISIIERDRTLPLGVLFARIDRGLGDWSDRLPTLSDDESARIGIHPRLGEMAAASILERFVLGHAEDHVTQLESVLAAPSA